MHKKTLSALILVESDIEWLIKCLPNITFTDEIVIVDNGIDFEVKNQILEYFPRHNIKYHFDRELNPVIKMLKYAGSIECDFIFWLHPDEIISSALGKEIKLALENDENIDAYAIQPTNVMFGTDFGKAGSYSVRILRKDKFQFRTSDNVHAEILLPEGDGIVEYKNMRIKMLHGTYTHYPNPYLLLYMVKILRYEMINVKDLPDEQLRQRISLKKELGLWTMMVFLLKLSRRFWMTYWSNRRHGFGGFCLAAGSVFRMIAEKAAPIEEWQFRNNLIDFNDTRGYINLRRERNLKSIAD